MHAITGGWAVLPDVPWTAPDGTSFRDLGTRAERLLRRIEAAVAAGLQDAHSVTLLAAQAGELGAALRDVSRTELPVTEIYTAGWQDCERAGTPRRRMRLRVL